MKNKICRDNIDVHWRPRCRGVVFLFRPKFCWRIFKRPKKVPEFSWLSTNYPVWKVSITFTDSCENEHSSWSGKTSYCSSQHCTGAQIWPFDHFAQLFQVVPWQHLPCQCHQHNPLYLVVSRIYSCRLETWCGVVGRTQRSVKCENVRIQRKGPARFQLFQDFKTQLTSSRNWWKCHSQQSFITFTFLRKLPTNTVSLASSNQS